MSTLMFAKNVELFFDSNEFSVVLDNVRLVDDKWMFVVFLYWDWVSNFEMILKSLKSVRSSSVFIELL